MRIGMHTGEAIKDADKFFGKTVIQAYRIAYQAIARQILVSSLLRELVESSGEFEFGEDREETEAVGSPAGPASSCRLRCCPGPYAGCLWKSPSSEIDNKLFRTDGGVTAAAVVDDEKLHSAL